MRSPLELTFATAPYRLSGLVLGSLLNHGAALAALGDAVHAAPYKASPCGPVLYIKPRNTLAGDGAAVAVPAGVPALEIGASLGLVIGRTACRVAQADALSHVAGYTLVGDVSVPHGSFYRPSVRFKALDASCFIGPRVVERSAIGDPDDVEIRVSVDGEPVHVARSSGMVRSASRLIADISDFMTLRPGDIVLLGVAAGAPHARAGAAFSIEVPAIGRLRGRVVTEQTVEAA